MRRIASWLLAVPLALAGSQLAHGLAYRLVQPDAHLRAHLLEETGHGYLHWLPLAGGAAAGAVLVGLLLAALGLRGRHRGTASVAPARWPFALLPLAAFAAQEMLERYGHHGRIESGALVERTFLTGLALQLPFALAAWAVARLLLRAAVRLARLLAPPRHECAMPPAQRPSALRASRRRSLLGLHRAVRGPPLPSVG